MAAAADDHAAGDPGDLVCGRGGGVRPDPGLCVVPRGALESYFGPGPTKRLLARLANAGIWAAGATALYNAGVAYVGRANEKVEPGYATPPASALVSGSDGSLLPFADLGQQGRRYVTDVVTPELIEEVMGEPAVAQPIRTYVGFNSEPLYQTGRAELALAELDRTGAFDRSYLLLVSPTGTGWVDHTLIETAEFLTRGRHRHLLCPVRPLPVVPVGAEGRPGPGPVPAPAVGASSSGWPSARRTGGPGCWCSARAWAPGPARTW